MPGKRKPHPELAELISQGWRDNDLARAYGVDERTILRWRKAEGLRPAKRRRVEPLHGTLRRYQGGCRCVACREANTEAASRHRAERRTIGLSPDDPRHGKASTAQNWGCKCDRCREALRERNATYYREHAPAVTVPKWTKEEIHAVRTLSVAQAAAVTGRTRAAIYSKRHRMGVRD